MAHRGPDGAGLWDGGNVVMAHRRLIVIDPSPLAHQPFLSPRGPVLVYNGELYNDAEVRAALLARGVRTRTQSDTETVLLALETWGEAAFARLRGMYALAYYDPNRKQLLLARDPLGVKPLYWRRVRNGEHTDIAFASELKPLACMTAERPRPDLVAVSGYLTTIRTTLGERTLFDGISTVLPGELLTINLGGRQPVVMRSKVLPRAPQAVGGLNGWSVSDVKDAITESVHVHLRSDVPTCSLLSGGLDSSIIASLAMAESGRLSTYCSGAPTAEAGDDFSYARQVAAHLGSSHTEAPVTREMFSQRWSDMVSAAGVPLSTPNEVAINEVARRLRAQGNIVALSGEGADELFGGYDMALAAAARFEQAGGGDGGQFHLNEIAWTPMNVKQDVLEDDAWRSLERDSALIESYRTEFATAAAERTDDDHPLQPHLRFMRRVNLAGLLLRLDSATMLAGVEGRTPFADSVICDGAEGMAMALKFQPGTEAAGPVHRTKIALREAFAPLLPAPVLARSKASFPLPFTTWLGDQSEVVRQSLLVRSLFTVAAVEAVCARPAQLWRLAWPMMNLALWGESGTVRTW